MSKLTKLEEIPVCFTAAMVAETESFSPSPRKPLDVMRSWKGLAFRLREIEPEPVTREQLYLAHDRTFVDEILDGRRRNGFGNTDMAVARSLPYTSGAMLSAAIEALENGRVAVAPVSGFHHACWNCCHGYCTFNGLIVTAAVLRARGLAQHIAILDFDQHWGNGTQDIIDHIEASSWIAHYHPDGEYGSDNNAERFVSDIPRILDSFGSIDLVLYQAGADPHIDDPLGGWLTTRQLNERDRQVFLWCYRAGVPIAWNLAGGYQEPLQKVLEIHDNTMRACVQTFL